MLNDKISSWWFLGGPPSFVACQSISVVVIRAVGSGGFFAFHLLSLVSVTYLCKHFMFIYLYSVCL
jgi:hypothetical protein